MELLEMMQINWKRNLVFGANPKTQREKDQVVSKKEKHHQAPMVVMHKLPITKMKKLMKTVKKKQVEVVKMRSYSSNWMVKNHLKKKAILKEADAAKN